MGSWRGWLWWVAAGVLLAALPAHLAPELRLLVATLGPTAPPDLVSLLRGLAAAVLLGCGLWWWAAATAVLLAVERGRRTRPRGCPRSLHRIVLGALGVAVSGGLAAPALARDEPAGAPASVEVLSGLPYPDRARGDRASACTTPPERSAHARPVVTPASPPLARRHVVVPGDTLWDLAARDLSPDASAADVSDRWQRIYRRNRAAVGPDPDLLVPGTSLELPTPGEETR